MRGQELLAALGRQSPGVEIHMGRQCGEEYARVTTSYQPTITACAKTLFDAAFEVARQMIQHPDCPAAVANALEEYDRHTEALRI